MVSGQVSVTCRVPALIGPKKDKTYVGKKFEWELKMGERAWVQMNFTALLSTHTWNRNNNTHLTGLLQSENEVIFFEEIDIGGEMNLQMDLYFELFSASTATSLFMVWEWLPVCVNYPI